MDRIKQIESLLGYTVKHTKRSNSRYGWEGKIHSIVDHNGTKVQIEWDNGLFQTYDPSAIALDTEELEAYAYLKIIGEKMESKNICWLVVTDQGKVAELHNTQDEAREAAEKLVRGNSRTHYVCRTVQSVSLSAPPIIVQDTNA